MTNSLLEALKVGVQMRQAQRTYFKTRSKVDLIESKNLEAKFDKAAKVIDEKQQVDGYGEPCEGRR